MFNVLLVIFIKEKYAKVAEIQPVDTKPFLKISVLR